ncbi:Glycerophosphodiester phosphodiesterase [Bertholletia excelsa]
MVGWVILVLLLIQSTCGQNHNSRGHHRVPQPWQTLNGERPAVIAREGYSGLFPEGSAIAINTALTMSSAGVVIYCTLQLSQDNIGFCLSSLNLANNTDIAQIFPQSMNSYNVSGHDVQGFFALDFKADQLANVSSFQSLYSRPDVHTPIWSIDQVLQQLNPPSFWLNVEYNNFYVQHKLDPALYIEWLTKSEFGSKINYISSSEIGFLKNMNIRINKLQTKLIFTLLAPDEMEPTTNQTFGSIIKDLNSIKMFASGIMVPKGYIWPVNSQMYLDQLPTSLVLDAHKAGLLVYAYNFANDFPASYNYSYDPTAEYLQFVDNSEFSVDGFLTDFPPTASEAISCLAHNKNRRRRRRKPMVISHNGASGVYPGSTDLAYQQAVDDGADIIDCSIQMSKDGIAFCLNSADLSSATSAKTTFLSRSATIPEIQQSTGIFSFDLTWAEIQTLKRMLSLIGSPFESLTGVERNPANKNKGKLVTLAEFLDFAKQKNISGILINIENAAYLASKKGLSITNTVANALRNATSDKQQVLIQSDDSAVLSKFSSMNIPSYKRVLAVKKIISNIPQPTIDEIKKYADAVNVHSTSIVAISNYVTTHSTGIVEQLHKANLSVYTSGFVNEFVAIPLDYFSDPILELATLISMGIDAVITDYPATATAYLTKLDYTIYPVKPGDFLKSTLGDENLSPAMAPAPTLQVEDVVDPPLPPISSTAPSSAATSPNATSAQPPSSGSQAPNASLQINTLVAIVVLALQTLAR